MTLNLIAMFPMQSDELSKGVLVSMRNSNPLRRFSNIFHTIFHNRIFPHLRHLKSDKFDIDSYYYYSYYYYLTNNLLF